MISFSQKKYSANLAKEVDAAKTREGKQLIFEDKIMKLYVNVEKGKVLNYSATDLSGKELKFVLNSRMNKGIKSCTICVATPCPPASKSTYCQTCKIIPCI